eukprot:m.168607 g.168607  ORF g.168607 m.168607 type:complete len:317 (-) comp17220_c0_seq1:948-1898(-)
MQLLLVRDAAVDEHRHAAEQHNHRADDHCRHHGRAKGRALHRSVGGPRRHGTAAARLLKVQRHQLVVRTQLLLQRVVLNQSLQVRLLRAGVVAAQHPVVGEHKNLHARVACVCAHADQVDHLRVVAAARQHLRKPLRNVVALSRTQARLARAGRCKQAAARRRAGVVRRRGGRQRTHLARQLHHQVDPQRRLGPVVGHHLKAEGLRHPGLPERVGGVQPVRHQAHVGVGWHTLQRDVGFLVEEPVGEDLRLQIQRQVEAIQAVVEGVARHLVHKHSLTNLRHQVVRQRVQHIRHARRCRCRSGRGRRRRRCRCRCR